MSNAGLGAIVKLTCLPHPQYKHIGTSNVSDKLIIQGEALGWTIILRICGGAAFLLAIWPGLVSAAEGDEATCPSTLTRDIPPRQASSPDGTDFAAMIASEESQVREAAIEQEILHGNLPSFLRGLKPVKFMAELASGRKVTATICVMPDYLAIGAASDFLRIPMNFHSAADIARHFGFVLPTRKMVDAIYQQSAAHLSPQPMPAGPQMRSTAYYTRHNSSIRAQRLSLGIPLGELISGHKKDVVISNRLAAQPGRIAIYGWQKLDGKPIQPLSTVHGANYADYSHGIRLVSDTMYIDGKPASVHQVLQNPDLAAILSDEGPVPIIAQLIPEPATQVARLEPAEQGLIHRVDTSRAGSSHSPAL